MSMEHLETKKQISALREKFGEDYWLSSHAGKFVQDIMGLEQSVSPNSLLSSTPIGPTSFNVAYDRAILASSIPDYESNSSISQVQSNDELEVKENLEASTEEPTESESQITEIPVPEETYDPEEGNKTLWKKKIWTKYFFYSLIFFAFRNWRSLHCSEEKGIVWHWRIIFNSNVRVSSSSF